MTKTNRGFGLLFWINTIAFGIYSFFLFLPTLQESIIGGYIHSLIALGIAFFLNGQNITATLETVSRNRLSLLEKFAVIVLIAIFAAPLTVTLSAHATTDWLRFVPILLAGATSCIAIWSHPYFWEDTPDTAYSPHLLPAGLLAATLYAVLFFHLTTAYYALPDFDPYYWLQKFQTEYTENLVTDIRLHRPLFSSIGYVFFQTSGIDLYAYFKYLLPSLALVVLIPAALVASRMRRFFDALLVFLMPAVSGSFILYSFSSIPQTILNLSFLSGIYFITYSLIARRPIFYFLAGSIFFLSMLYHEMAVLFFLPWIGLTLFLYRIELLGHIRKNPLATILALILITSHLFPAFFEIGRFLMSWTDKIFRSIIHLQPNLAFPATYINVDGNAVGWGDWQGVLRYYAFYFGPLVGASLLILGWHFHRRRPPVLIPLERTVSEHASLVFLTCLLILFFFMGEVFPRLFNIALLPERAMGFFGFTVVAFVMIALAGSTKRLWPNALSLILICTALLNAGAALYINSEKRFLITPTQISSAEWIRGSLPTNRIILTGSHWNLIRFHSQTEAAIEINDPLFYRDIRVFETARKNLPNEHQLYRRSFATLITNLDNSLKRIISLDPINERDRITTDLLANDTLIRTFLSSNFSDTAPQTDTKKSDPKIYIYYAKPNTESPYANRPYMKVQETIRPGNLPVFDRYPGEFRRVYTLPEDEVVIWELIQ